MTDVFTENQTKIARRTLRLSDVGAAMLGGMTKDEARDFLRRQGWSEARIAGEESKAS